MAIIIQRVTNNLSYSFTMFAPGVNNSENARLIIPAAAIDLDLLTLCTDDTLWALQPELIRLVSGGIFTVTGTIDTAGFDYDGVSSLNADLNPAVRGNVHLVSGTNITLSQVGQNITINSSGGGGGPSPSAPDTSIQFNNSGSFGGSPDLTWDGSSLSALTIKTNQVSDLGGALEIHCDNGDLSLITSAGGINLTADAGSSVLIKAGGLAGIEIDANVVGLGRPMFFDTVTTAQRDAFGNNPSWMIWNTDTLQPEFNNGTTWLSMAGGSGSPGGATTQVQYNLSGAFAGDAGMTYDGAGSLTLGGSLFTNNNNFVLSSNVAGNITIQSTGGEVLIDSSAFNAATGNWQLGPAGDLYLVGQLQVGGGAVQISNVGVITAPQFSVSAAGNIQATGTLSVAGNNFNVTSAGQLITDPSTNFVVDTNGNVRFRSLTLLSGNFSTDVNGNTLVGGTFSAGGGNLSVNAIGNLQTNGTLAVGGSLQFTVDASGNIVAPAIKITTTPNAGYVLTSDASGNGTWAPASGGGSSVPIFTITADTVLPNVAGYYKINGGGTLNITLPDATAMSGQLVTIKDVTIQGINISTQLGQTVDGVGGFSIGANIYDVWTGISDGTNWLSYDSSVFPSGLTAGNQATSFYPNGSGNIGAISFDTSANINSVNVLTANSINSQTVTTSNGGLTLQSTSAGDPVTVDTATGSSFVVQTDAGNNIWTFNATGSLLAPNGAVSAPAYSFTSNTQSGWYWDSTNSSVNLSLAGQDWIVAQRAGDSATYFANTSVVMEQDLHLLNGDLFTPAGGANLTFLRMGETLPVAPAATAIAQIDSTVRGFLPPRMTTTQKNAIVTPAEGLMVYDTTAHAPYFWNGSSWIAF